MDCVTRPAENTPKGHGSTSLHLAAIHQIFGFNGLIPSLHEYRSLGYFSPRARFIINPYTRIPASVLRQFEFPKIEESRIDMNWNRLENSEFAESSRWCISTLYYERKGEKKKKKKIYSNFQLPKTMRPWFASLRRFLDRVAKRRISFFSFNACDNEQGPSKRDRRW